MKFKGLTNIGKRHLANIHANNKTLEFTKIKFGDGTLRANENPEDFTNLKNFKTEKEILNAQQDENICSILAVIDNLSLAYGYHVREFGIYVKDNDREILYYYMNDDNEASWLPPASDGPHKMEIKINMVMSNTTSVTVNTTSNDLYLTNEYFLEKLAEKENVISNKKSGFNLDKTDEYNLDNTNKLGTARALKRLYDEIVRRIGAIKLTWDSITGKPNISSSVTSTSETDLANSKAVKTANDNANSRVAKTGDNMTGDLIIKGHRAITLKEMAQSLGAEFAGDISEVGEKEVGKAYWHEPTKKMYKCIKATSATSPEVNSFIPFDNNSLLERGKVEYIDGWECIPLGGDIYIISKEIRILNPYKDNYFELPFSIIPLDNTNGPYDGFLYPDREEYVNTSIRSKQRVHKFHSAKFFVNKVLIDKTYYKIIKETNLTKLPKNSDLYIRRNIVKILCKKVNDTIEIRQIKNTISATDYYRGNDNANFRLTNTSPIDYIDINVKFPNYSPEIHHIKFDYKTVYFIRTTSNSSFFNELLILYSIKEKKLYLFNEYTNKLYSYEDFSLIRERAFTGYEYDGSNRVIKSGSDIYDMVLITYGPSVFETYSPNKGLKLSISFFENSNKQLELISAVGHTITVEQTGGDFY